MKRAEALKMKVGDVLVFRELKSILAQGNIALGWSIPDMNNLSENRNTITITKEIFRLIREGEEHLCRVKDENGRGWNISLDMLESAKDLNVTLGKNLNA